MIDDDELDAHAQSKPTAATSNCCIGRYPNVHCICSREFSIACTWLGDCDAAIFSRLENTLRQCFRCPSHLPRENTGRSTRRTRPPASREEEKRHARGPRFAVARVFRFRGAGATSRGYGLGEFLPLLPPSLSRSGPPPQNLRWIYDGSSETLEATQRRSEGGRSSDEAWQAMGIRRPHRWVSKQGHCHVVRMGLAARGEIEGFPSGSK